MRKKFPILLAIFSLIAVSCGGATNSNAVAGCPDIPSADGVSTDTGGSVGLVYDIGGRGDLSFNDSAACGLEVAGSALGVSFTDASPNDAGDNRGELLQLAADDNPLAIGVGFLFEADAAAAAAENPDTNFAVIDSAMLDPDTGFAEPYGPNVAGLVFAEEQGSYLVGVAAALTTETDELGFIAVSYTHLTLPTIYSV